MDKIKCTIEQITFRNEDNGYSVVRCNSSAYTDSFTAVGIMPHVHIGSVFNLYGSWKLHPKYGWQFSFQQCVETLPATILGLKNYLASGLSELPPLIEVAASYFNEDCATVRIFGLKSSYVLSIGVTSRSPYDSFFISLKHLVFVS